MMLDRRSDLRNGSPGPSARESIRAIAGHVAVGTLMDTVAQRDGMSMWLSFSSQ